ncbi:MAG TPA: hypothetical protein VJZ72_05730 [Candidatus Limnocylindrales bacterium]|nr:hypothetical protein [Candidatus Limnocylindrales bacterium]
MTTAGNNATMMWYIHALAAQDLIREREREIAAIARAREARAHRLVNSDLPRFGRIRRPLARVATVVGSSANRAAVALDPQASRG